MVRLTGVWYGGTLCGTHGYIMCFEMPAACSAIKFDKEKQLNI